MWCRAQFCVASSPPFSSSSAPSYWKCRLAAARVSFPWRLRISTGSTISAMQRQKPEHAAALAPCSIFRFSKARGLRAAARAASSNVHRTITEALAEGHDLLRAPRWTVRRAHCGFDGLADRRDDRYEVMSGRREDIADLLAYAGPAPERCRHDRGARHLRGAGARLARRVAPAWRYRPDRAARLFQFWSSKSRMGSPAGSAASATLARPDSKSSSRGGTRAISGRRSRSMRGPPDFIAADMLRIEAGFVLFSERIPIAGVAVVKRVSEDSHRSTIIPAPEIALISFRADADRLRWPWQPSQQLNAAG